MAFICQAGWPEIGSTSSASFYVSPSEVCHQKKSIITSAAKEVRNKQVEIFKTVPELKVYDKTLESTHSGCQSIER